MTSMLRRYSLRTGLIGLTLCAIACAWFASSWKQSRQQKLAVEHLQAIGASVTYASDSADKDPPTESGPLRDWLGKDFFEPVTLVWFNGPSDSFEKGVDALTDLPHLRELNILGLANVTPQALRKLRGKKTLRKLSIVLAVPSDEVIDALAELDQVEELHISYMKTSASFASLRNMKRLKELSMSWNSLTFASPSDELIPAIVAIPELTRVSFYGTQITDAGLQELCQLRQLKQLVVGSPHITSAAMSHIANLRNLEVLGIWGWDLDDASLHVLNPETLPNLTSLDLFVKRLTDDGMENVVKFKLERLRVSSDGITDRSVAMLQKVASLESVDVSSTSVDPLGDAVKQFKSARPICKLRVPKTEQQKKMKRAFNDWKWGQTTTPRRSMSADGLAPY